MNQQRGRRFRSAKEAEVQEEKAKEKGEVLPTEARFDSNCITPGTPFMCRLNDALRYFIQHKISTSKSWQHCKVILSGHETPGEGEHKIMEYIRFQKAQKGYDPNTRHCLYGLDADLIMLGLCTHERHFSLLREEVKFGRKANKAVSVSQQRFFLLHLSLMREYLEQEFIALKGNMKITFDIEKIIDDWVLMGFLVGNDFIPNIPNLHINSNALPMLYEAYIKTMMTLDGYINEGGSLNLARLQTYIENLSKFDRDFFSAQYDDLRFLESKHQGAFNDRNDDTFGGNQDLMDMVKATEFEFDSPDDGESTDSGEMNFEQEFHQYRRNYYVNKMKYQEMTSEVLAEQAECYIRALQWTLSYYYHGVQSWSWYYPHHYSPFISDLKNFKDFDIKFELSKPFLPFQQLMSVLPAASRDHVPEAYKKLMTSPESELIDFYPTNFETDLNGKKMEWEAVVLIPFIDEQRLLKTLEKHDAELSDEEKRRNVHGPMYVYTYSGKSQGMLQAPLSFPSIGNVFCVEKAVYREEIQISKDKLVIGPSKGAMLDVYFTGFPTFKHLNYSSVFKHQNVKVFDQPSRGDNMIVVVEDHDELDKPTEKIAKEMMSKTVFVGWPHLMEAKVVKISDNDETFLSDGNRFKTDPHRFKNDTQSIKDHHSNRMGIDVGDIRRIIHVVQATGEEYKFDQKLSVFRLIKTYNRIEIPYPLQCIVQNITAYRKKYQKEVTLVEAFKQGTEVFMLANPYYGAFGEVTDVNCFESNKRVKVTLTVPEEPKFESVIELHHKTQGSYMNAYEIAKSLNISDNILNRITGTVLVIPGSKRDITMESTAKTNIGLQMKFNKQNEELAGYTKKDRTWLYSDKVVEIIQEYYCKFPVVFEVMSKSNKNGSDIYFESDFFSTTQGENNLQALTKWLGQLPHHKADRRQIGTEGIEKEILAKISETVNKTKELPMKKITMQVKPHLLFAPSLSQSTGKAPDPTADYQLFDRVVIAKETEKFSVGTKGTVVCISKVKDLNPVRQECVNKEDIYCEILFDNQPDRTQTGRLAIENLINITYGLSLDMSEGKPQRFMEAPKPKVNNRPLYPVTNTLSFSKILQNPEKSELEKRKNFSDMWNELKKASGSTDQQPTNDQPKTNGQLDPLSPRMAELGLTNNQMPSIAPPAKLPLPPVEWLTQVSMKMKNEAPNKRLEMPNQAPLLPGPFFNNGNIPGPIFSNPPSQPFNKNAGLFNNSMALGSNVHYQTGVFFPGNMMHGHNNIRPPQHIQQQRFFVNQNRPPRPNASHYQQQPSRPLFTQQNHQRPAFPPQQHNQPPTPQANPFIPLQASRKATKGKNIQQDPKKTADIQQGAKDEAKQEECTVKTADPDVPAPQASTAHSENIGSKPSTDRKCRLAISFGK